MKNIILTRNVFICHAFQEILSEYKCKDICVVDIDSYYSLYELLKVMKDANLHREQKIYFLKGTGILSKMLISITAFHVLDSLLRLKKVIRTARVPNYAFAVKYIRSYTKLSMMTHKEKLIANEILKYRDVPSFSIASAFTKDAPEVTISSINKIALGGLVPGGTCPHIIGFTC